MSSVSWRTTPRIRCALVPRQPSMLLQFSNILQLKSSSLQEWVTFLAFCHVPHLYISVECREGPQGQAYHTSTSSTCHPWWRGTRHSHSRNYRLRRSFATHQSRSIIEGWAEEEEGDWRLDVEFFWACIHVHECCNSITGNYFSKGARDWCYVALLGRLGYGI